VVGRHERVALLRPQRGRLALLLQLQRERVDAHPARVVLREEAVDVRAQAGELPEQIRLGREAQQAHLGRVHVAERALERRASRRRLPPRQQPGPGVRRELARGRVARRPQMLADGLR
jgi:hypothetical protein